MEVKVEYSYLKSNGKFEESSIVLFDKIETSMSNEEIVEIAQREIFKQHGIPNAKIGICSET